MTLKRGTFQVVCDQCGHTEDLGTEDFDEAKEAVEDEGFTTVFLSRGEGKATRHFCGTCS